MNALTNHRYRAIWLVVGLCLIAAPSTVVLLGEDHPHSSSAAATTSAPATTRASERDKENEKRKQEEIERVMEFLRVVQPDIWEQARTLRETKPQQFEALIRQTSQTVKHLEDLRKRNPKLFEQTMKALELNYRSLRMARDLKKPDISAADRERITKELEKTVADEFDVRQNIRQLEIDEQTEQLKKLEATLHDREKIKDQLIKKRVDDLLEKAPRLEW